MESAIHVLGFVMMLVGAISFVAMVILDLIALVTQKKEGFGVQAASDTPWADIIGKLPAKYLPSVVLFFLGLFLFDPVLFGKLWGDATGGADA